MAILMLTRPDAMHEAADLGCYAVKSVVLGSLFPMMVLSRLIAHSELMNRLCLGASRTRLWKRLRLSDALLPAVLAGLISGLPTTAAEVQRLVAEGGVSREEGAKAVALSSVPGPAFVILSVSSSVSEGVLRYLSLLLLSYFSASLIPSVKSIGRSTPTPLSFPEAMTSSVTSAISVSANIIFFSALNCIISSIIPQIKVMTAILLEMGSAAVLVKESPILISALLGWCGLSALSQIRAVAPSVSALPYAVTRIVSCVSMVLLQFFAEFLQNIL